MVIRFMPVLASMVLLPYTAEASHQCKCTGTANVIELSAGQLSQLKDEAVPAEDVRALQVTESNCTPDCLDVRETVLVGSRHISLKNSTKGASQNGLPEVWRWRRLPKFTDRASDSSMIIDFGSLIPGTLIDFSFEHLSFEEGIALNDLTVTKLNHSKELKHNK